MEHTRRVGLRELKEHTGSVVRRVRDTGEAVEITYHGTTVARIVPPGESTRVLTPEQWWREMEELADELSATWPDGVSAVEAIREQRRDL